MSKKQSKTHANPTTPATLGALVANAAEHAEPAKPKATTVALRGGPAVALVTTIGAKPYRVAAKHNADWFAQMQGACVDGPAAVANLIAAGVPSHFVAYCLRKGYALNADQQKAAE